MKSTQLQKSVPFGTVVRTELSKHADLIAKWPIPPELAAAHQKRKIEWSLGRLALQMAFANQRIDLAPDELIFDGHQALLLVPGFRFSISHTNEAALVWLADDDECAGIGVDIEPIDRKISDGVYEKLLHKKDRVSISPMQMWSVKEACFKSVSADMQTDLVVAKIFLNETEFETDETSVKGRWLRFEDDQFHYSFAWRT